MGEHRVTAAASRLSQRRRTMTSVRCGHESKWKRRFTEGWCRGRAAAHSSGAQQGQVLQPEPRHRGPRSAHSAHMAGAPRPAPARSGSLYAGAAPHAQGTAGPP